MSNSPEFVMTLDTTDAETVFGANGSEPHRPIFSTMKTRIWTYCEF